MGERKNTSQQTKSRKSNEFPKQLEKWEEKTEEDSRRKAITALLRSRPNAYKDAIAKSALDRIIWYFKNDKFGIISICGENNTKKKNFDMQFKLTQKLTMQKIHYVPHIGFWDKMGTRALFIFQVTKKQISLVARKIKLKTFIWGEKENWKCYEINTGMELDSGSTLNAIDFDDEFFLYRKTRNNRENLVSMKKMILGQNLKQSVKRIISVIDQRIDDLKKIEKAIIVESVRT